MSNVPLPPIYENHAGKWIDVEDARAHAAAVSAADNAALREASKSALLVLCALRDTLVCHPNMGKDIDFAIKAARAALGDKT